MSGRIFFRRTIAIVLLGIVLAGPQVPVAEEKPPLKAGFDCAKASSPVEHLICSDEQLAGLDKEMTALFTAARNAAETEESRREQLQAQRAWLKARLTTCDIPATGDLPNEVAGMRTCLAAEIRKRNEELAKAMHKPVRPQPPETASFDAAAAAREEELRIVRITPGGEDVEQRQQLVLQFNRPVVPIGRMDREASEIPVEIAPELNCHWRWLNRSALACNLDEKDYMIPATRYRVQVHPGIRDEAGRTIAKKMEHEFVTARPRVKSCRLEFDSGTAVRGWQAPGVPIINVRFNQQVTRQSVAESLYIEAKGTRYPLEVTPSPTRFSREAVLQVTLEKQPLRVRTNRKVEDEPVAAGTTTDEARLNWNVRPKTAIPEESEYALRVRPGLRSAFGPEPGIEDWLVMQGATFPPFALLGIRCTANDGGEILLHAGENRERCSVDPPELLFSAPINPAQLRSSEFISPALRYRNSDRDPLEELQDRDFGYGTSHEMGDRYGVPLPTVLRPRTDYVLRLHGEKTADNDPQRAALHDLFGRILPADVRVGFATDRYRPTLEWSGLPAVLEKGIRSDVSFYFANLVRARLEGRALFADGSLREVGQDLTLVGPPDRFNRSVLGVRRLLADESGAFAGTIRTLEPERVVDGYGEPVGHSTVAAQVTPFHVHAKMGAFSSLVWVTDLASGQPVAGAEVRLVRGGVFQPDAGKREELAKVVSNGQGLASLPGLRGVLAGVDANAPEERRVLHILVSKGRDLALLPVSTGDFHEYADDDADFFGDLRVWGTTAQGVYKPGAEVQYKLYVRAMGSFGVAVPEQKTFTLEIRDPADTVVEAKDIELSAFGSYAGVFPTGVTSPAGRYRITLKNTAKQGLGTGVAFLVADFVPASFRVRTTLNGEVYRAGEEVRVETAATLHSGGPFTAATNRYTVRIVGAPFVSTHPASKEYSFGSPWCNPRVGCGEVSLLESTGTLDQEGKTSVLIKAEGGDIGSGTLMVESAVEDDRGKKIANMATARYFGVDRFVGLKRTGFVVTAGQPQTFRFVVVDRDGLPVEGARVAVDSANARITAFKARGAGEALFTRADTEMVADGDSQELVSGTTGQDFAMVFNATGEHELTLRVSDSQGREHRTTWNLWVTGPDAVAWGNKDDNTLDLVVEKTTYAVGETAQVLVKNPYPRSKALVTIERKGIVKSWVEDLDGSLPRITFPVSEDMVPNFGLSVVVFAPRTETREIDGSYDQGKPEWRMGSARMEAAGKRHRLDCAITTDKDTYKPGEEVRAEVRVAPGDGAPAGTMELAVAVLDEAVYDLIKGGLDYFDPFKGMYGVRLDTVANYNILKGLVTHAPPEPTMKGDDPGGDGGMADKLRSNLKPLAFWQPALLTDDRGKASLSFKAPDNLTGWRILVLAVDAADHLGLGTHTFKVNRLTEIQPAMPNQVLEGDRFTAAFTVMNRSPENRTVKVRIGAQGTLAAPSPAQEQQVELAPFQRKSIKYPLLAGKVPVDRQAEQGRIDLTVSAGDALDGDGLRHHVPVLKRTIFDVGADYGTITEALIRQPLLFPGHIRPDAGEVSVSLSPTVIGDLEGAFRFMQHYPYGCWEQLLSRAVMAAAYQAVRPYLAADFAWEGTDAVIAETLNGARDFQAPNGGMAFFKPENERVDPYLSAYTALGFAQLDNLGFKPPTVVRAKLTGYLKEMLRTDVLPTFYTDGMASSVRAVALAALARWGQADADMLTRHGQHLEQMDLFGKSQMLSAALYLGGHEELVHRITDMILGSINETGGRLVFNEQLDDGSSRMLASVPRTNCAVLSSLMQLAKTPQGPEVLQDIPTKLARTVKTMRGHRDHFENTQENMFCLNALVDYARQYEQAPPNFVAKVVFEDEGVEQGRSIRSFTDKPLVVTRPINDSDPGQRKTVAIFKEGEGRLYYSTVMRYATREDQEKNVNAGMEILREYSVEDKATGGWRLLGRDDRVRRGDLVRVDLFLRLPAARTQVVVDDPVPGGLEPVNTELATASQVDAAKAKARFAGGSLWFQFADWQAYNLSFWGFNHRELRHHAARFFAEYLPPGNYHLAYSTQAVAEGDFTVLPVFAGEMYDADVYGKGVSGRLHVDP